MLMYMTNKLLVHEMKLMIIQFKNNVNKKNCKIFMKNKMMIIIIMYYKKIKANNNYR